ncbi:hypothetical protein OGAPHI_003414 [Ogataea philodendri]|uniref:Uncharacterized protein n=1 Tax=Ogataea philodendri TaxID=1378263 RepID=A0A9P8T628_9ASCO|nr:uncharacterized protein OGAPHI_003414 [Ogataea philodendri]KAH3666964.1 hypothetical protein OGAPHI_003414 [Ogataea philodendri]
MLTILELRLSHTSSHGSSTTHTTGNKLHNAVNVLGTRPLLVLHNLDTIVNLSGLHVLAVSLHTDLGVVPREVVHSQRSGVQTSKSDELPDVAEISKSLDVGLLVRWRHSSVPVEGWRKVVCQPLLRVLSQDTLGKLLGLLVDWKLGLHPQHVGVWSVSSGTVHGTLGASLVSVVTFSDSWSVPVKEHVFSKNRLGNLLSSLVGVAAQWCHGGGELLDGTLLVLEVRGLDGVDNGLVEQLHTGLFNPFFLNSLQLGAVSTLELGLVHHVNQWLDVWVGRSKNKVVVSGVDRGGDQGGSLGVGSGNTQKVGTKDISRSTDSNQSVDVFLDRNKHLTGHVSTLLGSSGLVLNVDSCGSVLNEHLGELHNGSGTSVSSISIGNDWSEKVNVWQFGTLLLGQRKSLVSLLSVVEKLGIEQVLHLVWNSVHRVVCKVWRWLVRGRGGGRGLPSRNVDGVQVLGHLGHVNWIKSTKSERNSLVLVVFLQQLEGLLGHGVRSVRVFQSGPSLGDLLCWVDSLHAFPTRLCPPFLDSLHFLLEVEFFLVNVDLCVNHS